MTQARVTARRLAERYATERTTSTTSTVHQRRLAAAYMAGYDRARNERRPS